MSDFVCRNSPSRIFVNIGARHLSFARTIVDKISYIYVKKPTPTNRYSSRYGPAKLDVTTTNFEPSLRRAVSSPISALWSYKIYQNVAHDVGYHSPNLGVDKVPASQKNNV